MYVCINAGESDFPIQALRKLLMLCSGNIKNATGKPTIISPLF